MDDDGKPLPFAAAAADAAALSDDETHGGPGNLIKPRQFPVQNIVLRLRRRETYGLRHNVSKYHLSRQFYQNVFPNYTIVNIEKPPCFLRKFSPNGRYLIAFSQDQTSIEIYEYQGPSTAEDLLKDLPPGEFTEETADNDGQLHGIRTKIFDRFFKRIHVVSVASHGEQLNRECSLFTDDSRYVIVGSAGFINEDNYPPHYEIHRSNESISLSARSPLEDYTLHLIDIAEGKLCDKRSFKVDKIFLSHNQSLHLINKTLAVLSVQHQQIHIFHIAIDPIFDEGKFVDVKTIGRFCYEDDDFLVSSTEDHTSSRSRTAQLTSIFRETAINALKHRLLVHLFRKARLNVDENGDSSYALRQFYRNFDKYWRLRMWKMQLLDEHHLLIKYANEEVITLRLSDTNSPQSLFMVYNFVTAQVIATFENTSEELLELFENFCDYFRNGSLPSTTALVCSPSNNVHARFIQQRYKQTIINARNGGHMEAVKRLLTQLPISAQSYTPSPYLDLSLFSYDDKWVSTMERPKTCGEHPIRFYARDSGLLRFKIFAGLQNRVQAMPAVRRLVAFTFHPFDPFAISVQRTNADYVVNLHLRHV